MDNKLNQMSSQTYYLQASEILKEQLGVISDEQISHYIMENETWIRNKHGEKEDRVTPLLTKGLFVHY